MPHPALPKSGSNQSPNLLCEIEFFVAIFLRFSVFYGGHDGKKPHRVAIKPTFQTQGLDACSRGWGRRWGHIKLSHKA